MMTIGEKSMQPSIILIIYNAISARHLGEH